MKFHKNFTFRNFGCMFWMDYCDCRWTYGWLRRRSHRNSFSPMTHRSVKNTSGQVFTSDNWHCNKGDHFGNFTMILDSRCWWQNDDFCHASDLSVSETCHQHILSPKTVTNMDVTATKSQNLAKNRYWKLVKNDSDDISSDFQYFSLLHFSKEKLKN